MMMGRILTSALLAMSMVSCSPDVPKLKPRPEVRNDKVTADTGTFVFTPEVDILFVVDSSGSMSTHQDNLANNIDIFVRNFTNSIQIDYNVGVVTTDMSSSRYGGRLQGAFKFITPRTPNGLSEMAANLVVGTNGSWEEMSFDPAAAALSQPLVDTWNLGFYRQSAHLAVIFITDAEDQSRMYDPQAFYNFLVNLKGFKEKVLGYGVIVPSSAGMSCERDENVRPARIESFLGMTINAGKNVMSLCDPDFGTRLSDISKDISKYVGGVIYLNRAPIIETIEVRYGTQIIPNGYGKGWVFDPRKNAIILGDEIEWLPQPLGTKIQVNFSAAQFEEEK
ncbi:MAG: vWA domain-containing protein [Bdellovibrionia bacterium]